MSKWEAVIEFRAALALQEIERMADKALLELGFTQEYVNRSRGQKRRRAKHKETRQ